MLSFTADTSEEELNFGVIAKGISTHIHFIEQDFFTLDTRTEFDDFWLRVRGSYVDQPYLKMDESRLIVLQGDYTVDKITESAENILIYATYTPPPQYVRPYLEKRGTRAVPYKLIRIARTPKAVKLLSRDAEVKPGTQSE